MKQLILFACFVIFTSNTHALSIASFDASRINYAGGVFETGNYSTLRSDLAGRGDTITTINSLNATSLSGVDVFYTSLLNTSSGILSASEQTALTDWVSAGGTLFSAGDISLWFPAYNSFLNPFAITIGPNTGGSDTANVTDLSHPITNGPNGLVSSFDFVTAGLFSSGPYDSLATYNGEDILIQMDFGLGQIVGIGDHNMFTDLYLGANERALFLNILDSASTTSIPEPSSITLLMLGVVGIALSKKKQAA